MNIRRSTLHTVQVKIVIDKSMYDRFELTFGYPSEVAISSSSLVLGFIRRKTFKKEKKIKKQEKKTLLGIIYVSCDSIVLKIKQGRKNYSTFNRSFSVGGGKTVISALLISERMFRLTSGQMTDAAPVRKGSVSVAEIIIKTFKGVS